jgi:hypothetical protein
VIFTYFPKNPYSGTLTRTRELWPVLGNLDPYSGTCMYCNCLLMTRTWELGPVLGNLDPYSGTLNLTRTRLCTKVSLIFCIFFDKCLKSYFYTNHWCLASLSCLMGHRIWIWAQKDWFYLEILGQEVGYISVTRTVHKNISFSDNLVFSATLI